jgi:hypothetical protein
VSGHGGDLPVSGVRVDAGSVGVVDVKNHAGGGRAVRADDLAGEDDSVFGVGVKVGQRRRVLQLPVPRVLVHHFTVRPAQSADDLRVSRLVDRVVEPHPERPDEDVAQGRQ